MRIGTCHDALDFCRKLAERGTHSAECRGRRGVYFCGPHALDRYHDMCNGKVIRLFSDRHLPGFCCSEGAAQILSVGRTVVHDQARSCAAEAGVSYATCPLPLSNDSFCTDRYGGEPSRAARRLDFPAAIILDWGLCESAGLDANKPGLGEAMGLVTSVRDFALCSAEHAAEECVPLVDAAVDLLFESWNSADTPPQRKLALLGASLSLKGLMIGLLATNDIVAGCDHMVSYELKHRGVGWPHGSLVAAGVLMTLPLFDGVPEGMVDKLTRSSLTTGLLTIADLQRLERMDIGEVLNGAVNTRPERNTLLRRLTPQAVAAAVVKIRRIVSEYA
jgi:glycerol dehydrogenase-like iron-containing ADH family enzyme